MGFLDDFAESMEEQGDLSEFKRAMKSELQTKVEEAKTKIESIDDDIWDWQTTVNNKKMILKNIVRVKQLSLRVKYWYNISKISQV